MIIAPSAQKHSSAPMSTVRECLKMRAFPRMSLAPVIHGCATPASTHGDDGDSENGLSPGPGFVTNYGLKDLPLMQKLFVTLASVGSLWLCVIMSSRHAQFTSARQL